jgi:O-antigen ligase
VTTTQPLVSNISRATPPPALVGGGHPALRRLLGAAATANTRAASLGFLAIVSCGFADGGYFPRSWLWIGTGFSAIAGLALLLRDRISLGRLERLSLAVLGGLALWMLASGIWGIQGTEALHEAERALAYLTALTAMLLVVERSSIRAFLAGTLTGVVAVASYGLADRFIRSPAPDPYEGTLLAQPVGYANALGVLCTIGMLIGLGLLLSERRASRRGLLASTTVVLCVALALTSSRGAEASLLVGLLVLAAFQARRRVLTARHLSVVGGAAVLATCALLVAVKPAISLGDRPAFWRTAFSDASQHRLLGSGAGSFDDFWLDHRDIAANVHDAHSLYLETLAELGPVGLMLLLGLLMTPIVVAMRARFHDTVPVATAAYVAFVAHAGIDWDWEVPVTMLAGLACGAALLTAGRPSAAPAAH